MDAAPRRERLLDLLHRGATTVPNVALELGISERTAYRDIVALRDQGYTIRATPGPGGGVRLDAESRPRPVHFEVGEILGMALSISMWRAMPSMPFAAGAQAALDRARRALSRDRQKALQRLQQRILVGPTASLPVQESLGAVDPSLLGVFETAFTGHRRMSFGYVDRFGETSQRAVECVALLLRAPAWYVLAWDLDKDTARMFRMDRISTPTVGEPLNQSHALSEVTTMACPEAQAAYDRWLGGALLS